MNTSYNYGKLGYLFDHHNKLCFSAPIAVKASSHCYITHHTTLICGYQSSRHGTTRVQHVYFVTSSISNIAHNRGKGSLVLVRTNVKAMLLLMAGDVETNPGPTGKYPVPLHDC